MRAIVACSVKKETGQATSYHVPRPQSLPFRKSKICQAWMNFTRSSRLELGTFQPFIESDPKKMKNYTLWNKLKRVNCSELERQRTFSCKSIVSPNLKVKTHSLRLRIRCKTLQNLPRRSQFVLADGVPIEGWTLVVLQTFRSQQRIYVQVLRLSASKSCKHYPLEVWNRA